MVHTDEIEMAKSADAARRGYFDLDWDCGDAGDFRPARWMGDDRIVVVPLSGQTLGAMGALVELDRSGRFLLASDALNARENLDRDIIPRSE